MKTRLTVAMTAAAASAALTLPLLATAPATAAPTSVSVTAHQTTETTTGTAADQPVGTVSARATKRLSAPDEVQVGATFKVTGKVDVRRKTKRVVGIFEARGRKWVLLSKKKTSKKGAFAFAVRAGSKVGERRFAVAAARMRGTKGYEKHFAIKVVKQVTTTPPPPPPEMPTVATAGLDKGATTTFAAPITVAGAVGGGAPAGRLVVIEQTTRGGWVEIARTTSAADGTYAVALPTDFAWSGNIRAFVPAAAGAAAAYSAESAASVTPSWALPGNPAAYSFLGGKRARWNPCAPIRVKVNYSQQPLPNARAHVEQALAHVRAATGLTFVITGDTNSYPWPAAGYAGPDTETDLLIAFGTQANTTVPIAGSTVGMGGPTYYNTSDAAGPVGLITKGQVILDVNPDEFTWNDARLANVLRHEIGHAVGAGHTDDQYQIMYPMVSPNLTFGAGDYTNLSQNLGRSLGCLTIPGVNARTPAGVTARVPAPVTVYAP